MEKKMPLPYDDFENVDWVQEGDAASGTANPDVPAGAPNIPMGQILENIFAIRDSRTTNRYTGTEVIASGGVMLIDKTPFSSNDVDVFFNGSLQEETEHYSVSVALKTVTWLNMSEVEDDDVFVIKSRGYDV